MENSTLVDTGPHKSLSDYLELIAHELPRESFSLLLSAYKVDGRDGIKCHCECRDMKSVDYFYAISNGCRMIEFSDLELQFNSIQNKIAEIKSSDISKPLKKEIVTKYNKEIVKEFSTKYQHSYLIRNQLDRAFLDVPNGMVDGQLEYHIIISRPDSRDENENMDFTRFLEAFSGKIMQSIPDTMICPIRVYDISSLVTPKFNVTMN
ncbi:hypothetical protein [Aeromonas veronii]|uniref:hypothetical protein n=1 Tax=Aeromonas veronii TaxID=654 RepID=UPI003BA31630